MRIFKDSFIFSVAFLAFVAGGAMFSVMPVRAQVPVEQANIVVDEAAGPSLTEELVSRVQNSWPWYVTRASGLVAAIAIVLLMLTGIGFITGTTYNFLEPLVGWATHRALGIILFISLVLHIIALYFDHFVPFGVADLLIPFTSSYKPVQLFGVSVGSLYVALGIVSFYLVLLIVLVSLLWVEKKTRVWNTIHFLSYLAVVFAFVHALFLGTDLSHGLLRYVWILAGAVVLGAALMRFWRVKTL